MPQSSAKIVIVIECDFGRRGRSFAEVVVRGVEGEIWVKSKDVEVAESEDIWVKQESG